MLRDDGGLLTELMCCAGLKRTAATNKKFWDVFTGIEESNAVVRPCWHPGHFCRCPCAKTPVEMTCADEKRC